jgi:hypothetical protein
MPAGAKTLCQTQVLRLTNRLESVTEFLLEAAPSSHGIYLDMIHVPCQYSHREIRDQQEWLNARAGIQRRRLKTWKHPEARLGALEHSKVRFRVYGYQIMVVIRLDFDNSIVIDNDRYYR